MNMLPFHRTAGLLRRAGSRSSRRGLVSFSLSNLSPPQTFLSLSPSRLYLYRSPLAQPLSSQLVIPSPLGSKAHVFA